jgi:hypothetical protein
MRPKRALAVGQVLFMFPAILFMGALIVRELRPRKGALWPASGTTTVMAAASVGPDYFPNMGGMPGAVSGTAKLICP